MKFDCKGTGVALVTPFNKNQQIDWKALEKLVQHCIAGGVEYLVPMGTTGESVTLSKEEKKEVFQNVAHWAAGKVKLVAGVGGNHTAEVLKAFEEFDLSAYHAILSVCPYYNKPTQEGIFRHYQAVANASPLSVILYNVPGRTGVNMTAATTLRIAQEVDNVIAIKEASANFDQFMQLLDKKPAHFSVISGDDPITLPMIALGATGVISVVGNAYPKQCSDMVRACLSGDFAQARPLHYQLLDITNLLFAEGNPGGIKAVLNQLGICENEVRMPLAPISAKLYEELGAQMKRIN